MSKEWREYATILALGAVFFAYNASPGDAAPAGATPAAKPSPTPTPDDPCGGDDRLLATANRPTVGYSPCAVKRGTAVFELGYQNEVEGTPQRGSVESQVPQNFLRLGVATRFEFDVIGPNYESLRSYAPSSGSTISGVADSGLGFKYELPPSQHWTIGFDGLYTGPNGTPGLTGGSASITGNLDASYSLSSAMAVGTTIALSATGDVSHQTSFRYGTTMPSLVVTAQIPHAYQFYAEYVYLSKIAADKGGRAFTDFGVQKLLGTRTEIDIEYGHAFTGIPGQRFNYIGSGAVIQLW